MPITNFRIRKIEAERNSKKVGGGKVDVKSNFTISSIKKNKDPRLGEFLEVRFNFNVEYTPDLGKIDLEGELWYYTKDLGKVAKVVGDKVELDKETTNEVSTSILQESMVEAIEIAKKVRLPIPIKLPKVTLKEGTMKFNKAS